MARVFHEELVATIETALRSCGLDEGKARQCAQVHAQSTCDGVLSHGLYRVPRFIEYVRKGLVKPDAVPTPVFGNGAIEVFDGNMGIGITNALFATDRAMKIARDAGMGLVALRNTTHWMRGGTYGWHAAEDGMAIICWTNTEPVMPAWGSKDHAIGNNPLVMAMPRTEGPLVLDMAMSQFSYGRLQTTRLKGEKLPVAGGFDADGRLTDDPGAIEVTRRILPTGYWKGSGLAIMLDALSAFLAQGSASHTLDATVNGSGGGTNQIFLVFDPASFGGTEFADRIADGIAQSICDAVPDEAGRAVKYPGQSTLERRERSMAEGMEVDDEMWRQVRALANMG